MIRLIFFYILKEIRFQGGQIQNRFWIKGNTKSFIDPFDQMVP